MSVDFLSRQGVVEEAMRALVTPAPARKEVPIGFIGIGLEMHFDWQKAKESHSQALEAVSGAFAEGNTLLAEPEPIQTKAELLELLNKYAASGMKALIVYQASYIAGDLAMALAIWLRENKMPLLSWSHTEVTGGNLSANRLCGQNFLLNNLSSMGVPYTWLFKEPTDRDLGEPLGRFIRAASARARLKQSKILMVGGMRVPGFYDCELNEVSIAKHFGLDVERVDLSTIFRHGEKFSDEQVSSVVEQLISSAKVKACGVTPEQLALSVRLSLAVADFTHEGGYLGVALKNWPELFDHYGIAGDGAGALVQDLGIPVADESDMGALLTMVTFNELTLGAGLPTLMDLSYIQQEENKIGLWHCGGTSTKLMREGTQFEIQNHSILDNFDPEESCGMLFEFLQETGPVTIAKYQFPHASTVFAFEGEIVDSPMRYRGCYGEIAPKGLEANSVLSSVMSHGLDHHWIMARGNLMADLQEFNHWAEIDQLQAVAPKTMGHSLVKKMDF